MPDRGREGRRQDREIRCKKCGATIVINGNEGGSASQAQQGGSRGRRIRLREAAARGDQWTVNVADGNQRTMGLRRSRLRAIRSGVVSDETYCWKRRDGATGCRVREDARAVRAAGGKPAASSATRPSPAARRLPPRLPRLRRSGARQDTGRKRPRPATQAPPRAVDERQRRGQRSLRLHPLPAQSGATARGRVRGRRSVRQRGASRRRGRRDDERARAGMPQASNDPGKLTGQRNENSVLFSLNALTQNAPKEDAGGGGRGRRRLRAHRHPRAQRVDGEHRARGSPRTSTTS